MTPLAPLTTSTRSPHKGKSVLLMGLKQALVYQKPPVKYTLETLRATARANVSQLRKLGYDPLLYLVDAESTSVLEDLRRTLRRKRWDGVSVGFGLRGTKKLTGLFEDVVNLIVEEGGWEREKGEGDGEGEGEGEEGGGGGRGKKKILVVPKLMFATGPDRIAETVRRAFEGEKAGEEQARRRVVMEGAGKREDEVNTEEEEEGSREG